MVWETMIGWDYDRMILNAVAYEKYNIVLVAYHLTEIHHGT